MIRENVPSLKEIEEENFKEALKNREIKILENELELLKINSLMPSLNELTEKGTYYIFNFLDREMENPYNEKKTANDLLNSYLMTLDDVENITNKLWKKEILYDNNGNVISKKYKIKDIVLHRKYSSQAIKYWNDNKLNNHIETVKKLMNGNISEVEIVKNAIFNASVDNNVSEKERTENRKLFVDISGLKQNKTTENILVFSKLGGKEMAKNYNEISGNEVGDIEDFLESYDESDD